MVRSIPIAARWTYEREQDGPVPGVPELVMLGGDEPRRAAPLSLHAHPGCYEFVLMEKGKASWELDGRLYETQAGELFHTRPGEMHRGGFNVIEPSKFWWLIFRAPEGADWLRLAPGERDLIDRALAIQPRVANVGLLPTGTFRRLRRELAGSHPFRSLFVRQALLDLLLSFLRPDSERAAIADDLLRQFDRIAGRIRREPEWRPSVQDLADEAGISASHFYRTFQAHTGFSPMNFLERERVEEACRLLEADRLPVTQIAHLLGYPSSQHFATVFKRIMGSTPREWKNTKRDGREDPPGG
ncbi:AraC family transcriptional regulator [Cohnella nanjingensis]|uniref:Helix-turn-helix transcriptional regulator n=1 Tax=Cohnella nanjingensis TaxID=1387779 RepID=A0A7X0RYI0_9BACL|nr:AraC family transcriptional regulator [Cohnella nanjingensis]MBB6674670.1 helix-turn-helix transcriptional regulator [Cohnella nanjingensis]